MSYNNYNQGPYGGGNDNGYGQQNPYANTAYNNPQDNYGVPNYQQQQGGRGQYEMEPLNGGPGGGAVNFFAEVQKLREDNQAIENKITEIERLHSESLTRVDESSIAEVGQMLDESVAEISEMNHSLARRIREWKSKTLRNPEQANQIGVEERRFKAALTRYQQVEVAYQRKARDQLARQYKIANPDATEDEIRQAQESGDGQIFSQAVMQNRRGAARSALAQVRSRHVEIQKIEQTMVELAQLFEQMNQLVVEQGEIVQQIDDHGTRIHDDTKQANTQLAQAVSSAKGARKKKWWCLGICVLIIIIVLIAVLATVRPWEAKN